MELRITGITPMVIALPPARRHPTALRRDGGGALGRYVIVTIETDAGISGLGEATVLVTWAGDHGRYFGESTGTTLHLIDDLLGPALVGSDPLNIEMAHERMNTIVRGYPYAKSAIDMALYDIAGKALGVPVYQLLGGLVRSEIPLAHSVGILDDRELVEKAVEAVDEGIRTVKLKVGLDAQRDVRAVTAVRKAVGDDVTIVMDANSGYRTPKEAIRVLERLDEVRLGYAEQPVEGLSGMAQVCRATSTPVMADESAWNEFDILEIARRGAADYISIYTTKPGGILPAKKSAAVAHAAGLPCNVNGSAETGVGNAANLHLAASTPAISLPIVVPITTLKGREQTKTAGVFYTDDIITEPFTYAEGKLQVPQGPGLGVQLDMVKVEKYRVG